MSHYSKIAVLGALMSLSAATLADDSPSAAPVMSPRQKMQACVTQQKAANPAMSKADLRKTCAEQLKSQENHPSVPASPNNAPQR